MLVIKTNPVGKDVPIQSLQQYLYNKLKVLWQVNDNVFDGNGRCYRNKNDKGFVPELFVVSDVANNTQYKAVWFDKTNHAALFFFDVDDKEVYKEGMSTVTVSIIFMCNLAMLKTKSPIQHRADEEIRNDVRKICSVGLYQMQLKGEEVGYANVFRSFGGLVNNDGEVFEDRHPLYCFKMIMELNYLPSEIKC